MDTKEPDSRLSVRKQDLEDEELYRFNQVINDLYSKITTARDETDNAIKKFTRSGVIATGGDLSSATVPGNIPPLPEPGIPQPQAGDWALNTVVYSAGEDGLQYGFASATILNKPADVDYYSMFIQDYSSGYVNTSGTSVTLTSASKEAGNTFEGCVAGQVININSVAYVLASDPTAPYETATLTTSAGTQTNVYFNLNPVNGKWEEIASDAEAGTWQLRPPTGWDVPCCITASTKEQKTFQPPDGIEYKRLVFSPWGVASQVTNFTVKVEQQNQAGVPSGRFVVNFTKPLDPEYYYTSVERLLYLTAPSPTPPYWTGTQNIGATARVDVSGNTITYNGTTFTEGQYFTYIQPGDIVYVGGASTLTDANTYTVDQVISSTQLTLVSSPPAGTDVLFAQWGRVAGEIDPFTQNDFWPLPSNPEYWKFRARSVNYREIANNTSPPDTAATVPSSSGITSVAPGTITAASFASTIRPVDLVTTSSISVTSIVVVSNSGTVTTSSPHGLTGTRQVAIFGGTGTSSKLNGLYTATVTGLSTFTITTSGVSNGTYSAGLNEVPLPVLPSSTYPVGAVAFMTANTKLYRSNGTAWTIAADGSDIVANSITAGQIAAGAISTTELFAGEILVGQGSGKPTLFKVVDSSSNMIGFIGDITTPTYPVNFVGAYFINLRIGPNISTPIVSASSSGVTINGATFALTANGITTTIDNTSSGGYTAGLRISNATATKLIQVGLSGSSTPSILLNDTTFGSPSAILEVTTGSGGRLSTADLSGTTGVEVIGQYSLYSTGIWRGSITTGRIEATRDITAGGTITAGGLTGTSGQLFASTGTGVQWQNIASRLSAGTGVTITGTTTATIAIGQSVGTTSDVTFNRVNLANGVSAGLTIKDTGGTGRLVLSIASDNHLYLDNNDGPNTDVYIRASSGRYVFIDGSYFAPVSNNSISCGLSGYGWSNVYSYAYYAHDGATWNAGWTGTFSTGGQTVTVQDGIIINVV